MNLIEWLNEKTMKYVVAVFLISLISFIASSPIVLAQQSHPLSEVTPIDVNFDMFQKNMTNVSYIGIGLTNPSYPLHVSGDVYSTGSVYGATALCIATDCKTAWSQIPGTPAPWDNSSTQTFIKASYPTFINASNVLFVNSTSGNVGIGTSSPTQNLVVVGNINATGTIYGTVSNADTVDNYHGYQFGGSLGTSGNTITLVSLNGTTINSVTAPYATNAGQLNGQAASYYLDTSATAQTKSGSLTISGTWLNATNVNASTIYEGGTALSSKYLGISATAADSSKLNGQASTYYLNTSTSFGGNVSGTYNALNLAANSVDSAKIADNSITTSDISQIACDPGYALRVLGGGTYTCDLINATGGVGDITAVNAGTGLTGGGTSGDVTLNANTTYLQRRIVGTCSSGNAIKVVNEDGTVTCESIPQGTITSITATGGLTASPNPITSSGSIYVANGGINETHLASSVAGTGLSGGVGTPLSVNYGSSAGTAVQGNTQVTVSAGTGLSGGGTITLGSGGTATLSLADTISGDRTFSGDVTFNKNIRVAGNITYVNYDVLNVNGTIKPPLDNWFDIGSSSNRWRSGYFGTDVNATRLFQGSSQVLDKATSFGGDVSGTYSNLQLGSGVVGASELATTISLGSGQSISYGSGTINANQLAGQSSTYYLNTSTQFSGNASGAYNTLNLAANSVDSAKIVDSSITTADIGNNQVTTAKIASVDCGAGKVLQQIGGGSYACVDVNPANVVNGSGTQNYVAKFTGSNTIGNSIIQDTGNVSVDSGTLFVDATNDRVGIGTNSPTHKLVVGSGTTGNVNPNTYIISTDASDARLGAVVNNKMVGLITAGGTYGGVFAYDYTAGSALDLALNQYGGNVGIGTTSPSAKLEIQGSGTGGLSLNVTGDLYVNDTSGNVGIGTASPSYAFHVSKSISGDWMSGFQNSLSGAGAVFMANGGGEGMAVVAGSSLNAGSYAFKIDKVSTPYFYVKGDGNVGIGTTSPTGKLSVQAPSATGLNTIETIKSSAGYDRVNITYDGDNVRFGIAVSNTNLLTPHFTIANDGNVGIGTTSPSERLSVQPATNQTFVISAYDSAGARRGGIYIASQGHGQLYLYDNASTLGALVTSNSVSWFNGGNVGIGTTSPVKKLDVVGDINATTSIYSAIYYDSSGTTYYLDPANSGTALNLAGNITMANNKAITMGSGSVYWDSTNSRLVIKVA